MLGKQVFREPNAPREYDLFDNFQVRGRNIHQSRNLAPSYPIGIFRNICIVLQYYVFE